MIVFCTSLHSVYVLTHLTTSPLLQQQQQYTQYEPTIAVAVLVTPNSSTYWNRFVAMSAGWYRHFEVVKGYSFHPVAFKQDSRLIQVEKLFSTEKTISREDVQHNMHVAAFQRMRGDTNDTSTNTSDWYLQVDDDTVLVPANLRRLVRLLDPSEAVLLGKCAVYQDSVEGRILFVVGVGGILMSRALMLALEPHFPACRRRYNRVFFADARVGACVSHTLNQSSAVCRYNTAPDGDVVAGGRRWSFTNRNVRIEAAEHAPQDLVVSMHEKAPSRTRLLNRYVQNLTERGIEVTWGAMTLMMDEDDY